MSEGKELAKIDKGLIENIKSIVLSARKNIARKVNHELVVTYWQIGKQKNNIDNQTSRQIILGLSKQLRQEIGKGFSRSNLFAIRKFYMEYPGVQTLSGYLTWSFISELLIIEDKAKRSFYEKEAVNTNWSFRKMKRQIDSSLYKRHLLSNGITNKEEVNVVPIINYLKNLVSF